MCSWIQAQIELLPCRHVGMTDKGTRLRGSLVLIRNSHGIIQDLEHQRPLASSGTCSELHESLLATAGEIVVCHDQVTRSTCNTCISVSHCFTLQIPYAVSCLCGTQLKYSIAIEESVIFKPMLYALLRSSLNQYQMNASSWKIVQVTVPVEG